MKHFNTLRFCSTGHLCYGWYIYTSIKNHNSRAILFLRVSACCLYFPDQTLIILIVIFYVSISTCVLPRFLHPPSNARALSLLDVDVVAKYRRMQFSAQKLQYGNPCKSLSCLPYVMTDSERRGKRRRPEEFPLAGAEGESCCIEGGTVVNLRIGLPQRQILQLGYFIRSTW